MKLFYKYLSLLSIVCLCDSCSSSVIRISSGDLNDYTFTKWESDDDRIVIYVEGSDYGFGWGFLKDEDTEYQGPYFVRFLSPSNIGPYFSMSMENGPHWSYILKRIKNIEEWDGVLEAYQGSKLQFKFIPTKIIAL